MKGSINPTVVVCKITPIEMIKIALAGVGNPIKESVCRVSMLNLARR